MSKFVSGLLLGGALGIASTVVGLCL